MKLLLVVTPLYIHHGCSNWKTSWEENFTVGEFSATNIKSCGPGNVRKQIDIKGSDKYDTSEISLTFDIM